jgi:hypothetical protein
VRLTATLRRRFWPALAVFGALAIPADLLAMYLLGCYARSAWNVFTTPAVTFLVPVAFFYVLAVLVDNWRKMASLRRLALLASVVLLPVAWIYLLPFGGRVWAAELGMRRAISSGIGTDRLRSWALALIEEKGGQLEAGRGPTYMRPHEPDYDRLVPRALRDLRPEVLVASRADGVRYARVYWGSGMLGFGWGLVVVPAGQRANWPSDYHRWRPGIYTYHAGS